MAETEVLPPSPDTRPSFIKIIFPLELTDLTIPAKIFEPRKTKTDKTKTFTATLRGPFGDSDIKVLQKNGGVCFSEKGWEKFLKKNSVMKYELLLFTYNGNMSFDVEVFGHNGCSKSYSTSGESITAEKYKDDEASASATTPSFQVSMKASNVGVISNLVIPAKFVAASLGGCNRKTVTLKNAKGVSWLVSITPFCKKYANFSKGWKDFAEGNDLGKGDVCIFKLVEENVMEVQIFRF